MSVAIIVNEHKATYVEQNIYEVLKTVVPTATKDQKSQDATGSMAEKPTLEITDDMVIGTPRFYDTLGDDPVACEEVHNGKLYRIEEEQFRKVMKVANNLFKEKSIQARVNVKYVQQRIFDWIFYNSAQGKEPRSGFVPDLIEKIASCVDEYIIRFPVTYLDIIGKVTIGKSELMFYTKRFVDSLEVQYEASALPASEIDNMMELLKERLQGKVYIGCKVIAEAERAREIAAESCALSMDIIKICSRTLFVPNLHLPFNIDFRTRIHNSHDAVVTTADRQHEFTIHSTAPAMPYNLNDKEWRLMNELGIKRIHDFVIWSYGRNTELNKLLTRAISMFSAAIDTADLHDRVAKLFTIYESLLLPSDNASIIESVCKYATKIVFDEPEERTSSETLLKSMYVVRSKLVHHGTKARIDLEDLKRLQVQLLMLLIRMMEKARTMDKKRDVLQEIEDRILKA